MEKLIAPSILAADFGRFASEAKRTEEAGADWLHVDVMDGHFVPNISFGAGVTAVLRQATGLPLDVHLMITHPQKHVDAFIKAGASHIHVHVESDHPINRTLSTIKSSGLKAGAAINPETPVEALEVLDWSLVDMVLCMTVHPGFGGQEFITDVLAKIRELVRLREQGGHGFGIVVDGGVNLQTARLSADAGANIMVAGTSLYAKADMRAEVAAMRKAIV